MNTRTTYLDFRESGTDATRGKVISLAEAQAKLKRQTAELAPVLQQAAVNGGTFERVMAASTSRVIGFGAAMGPAGQGLAMIASRAPMAAMGLTQMAAAQERAALTQRLLNGAVVAGAGGMVAASVAALAYADNAMRAGDSYQALSSRIRANTDTMIEAAAAERALYANAADARGRVDDQARLFNRVMPALKERGMDADVGTTITRTVSKGITLGGASPTEQSGAMQQFAQALGSGNLGGDELRTMKEAAPQLLRYIAQNLELNGKIGVSFGSLKKLGAAGLLTTDRLLAALLRAGPQIEADFINAPKSAQQQWGVLMDTINRGLGQFAVASGAQSGLVDWLADLGVKAEEFRKKMVYDPSALNGFKAATGFIGDAVGSIAQLGGAAVTHFDEIVTAGQLIIALKLGDVFAGWFKAAATGAQSAIGNAQAFVAAARGEAAATGGVAERGAATALRTSAQALTLQATELQARADIAAAQAAAAKAAADRMAAQASDVRALHGAKATVTLELEAAATGQAALASKLDEQAKRAQTNATNASTAAVARNAVAQQAEAVVTTEVTAAMLAKNVAAKAGLGLYTLLGGAWGIAALAVGALAFAVWKAEEAHRAEVAAMREKILIGDQLESLTRELTAATWAEVPAIQARIDKLYAEAEAAKVAARENIRLATARQQNLQEQQSTPATMPTSAEGVLAFALMGAQNERTIRENREALEAGRRAAGPDAVRAVTGRATGYSQEAANIRSELSRGKDGAGRPLSAADRTSREDRLDQLFATGQTLVDRMKIGQAQQQAAVTAAKGTPAEAGLIAALDLFGKGLAAANGLVTSADRQVTAPAPQSPAGKPKAAAATPAPVNAALQELTRQEYLPKAGLDRFSLAGGSIADSSAAGAAFKARSEDEATAAAKYVQQIEAINAATDAQIVKTGESRDALRQAASARLNYAVQTSQASQAEDRWADIMAEVSGESRAVIKAEREVNDVREKGAAITDEAVEGYINFVRVREAAKRTAAAVSFDAPLARDAAEAVLSRGTARTDGRGLVDAVAETRRIEAARAQIILESEAQIRAESEREAKERGLSTLEAERLLADRLAVNRLAVEADLQERILKLNRQRVADQVQYEEDQIREAASKLEGAFHDAVFGGDVGDIGKRLVNDLLETIYKELIGNPMRKAIQDVIRAILHPPTDEMGNAGGGGSSTAGTVGTILRTIGSIFGFEDGGLFEGDGGPRDDANLIRISNKEFIVNAASTARHLPLLEAINSNRLPAFADGGLTGGGVGGGSDAMLAARLWGGQPDPDSLRGPRELLALASVPGAFRPGGGAAGGGGPTIGSLHVDASINAPFAESVQLRQVAVQQQQMQRALPDIIVGVLRKVSGRS